MVLTSTSLEIPGGGGAARPMGKTHISHLVWVSALSRESKEVTRLISRSVASARAAPGICMSHGTCHMAVVCHMAFVCHACTCLLSTMSTTKRRTALAVFDQARAYLHSVPARTCTTALAAMPRVHADANVPGQCTLSKRSGYCHDVGCQLQVGATCKHFAAYSLENADGYSRLSFNASVSQRQVNWCFPSFRLLSSHMHQHSRQRNKHCINASHQY